jgi:phage anti-repressor protein
VSSKQFAAHIVSSKHYFAKFNYYLFILYCAMKVTDFLKKYTSISHDFIDDFYSFYDDGKNEYEFVINLSQISLWLGVEKKNLKRMLQKNFLENDDYIQINIEKITRGGNNNLDVILTYDCFKMLCMLSQSKKADSVRKYYIEVEKHLLRYKNEIISDFNKQLGIKNNNIMKTDEYDKSSIIYVLKVEPNSDIYKIGRTKDIKKRIKNYNVGSTKEYEIMFIIKVSDNILNKVESCIKKNLEENIYRQGSKEVIQVSYKRIIETIKYCNGKESYLYAAPHKKNLNKNSGWLMFIDSNKNNAQLYDSIKNSLRNVNKKNNQLVKHNNKQTSKRMSNKVVKRTSKKNSKKASKRMSKKVVKRTSKKNSKKASKRMSKKIIRRASKKASNHKSSKVSKRNSKKLTKIASKRTSFTLNKKLLNRKTKSNL